MEFSLAMRVGLEGKMYQTSFTQLIFQLEFLKEGRLPRYKTSALRGGLGQMLLAQNCFGDSEKCLECKLHTSCLVQKVMYANYVIKPDFVTKESMGFVMDCKDQEEVCVAGQRLTFSMTLFGNTISYFSTILYAFTALGMVGLGKDAVPFFVRKITNRKGKKILDQGNIIMKNVKQEILQEYIAERMAEENEVQGIVRFVTPLSMKYRGKVMQELNPDAVFQGIERRVYMLNCFEGLQEERQRIFTENITTFEENSFEARIRRYSSTHKESIILKGIMGELYMEGLTEEQKKLLYAGEILHIGKNTKFGFGKYVFL